MYLCNNRPTKYTEQKLIELKGERIPQSQLKILLPLSQKLIEQLYKNILKEMEDLNNIINTPWCKWLL